MAYAGVGHSPIRVTWPSHVRGDRTRLGGGGAQSVYSGAVDFCGPLRAAAAEPGDGEEARPSML